ncbi:MAG: hypothetical protein QOE97_3801 [Pseudonocardiales bacterium]|nr:hypothetical protein [Pseudonocardiales bacterium]
MPRVSASRLRSGFTTRASCLLAAGSTALLCGLVLGVIDLVRAGVLAIAIPLVAAVSVHRSRVQLANRRTVEPERAQAGAPVTMHLAITNRSVLRTGALLLEDVLPAQLSGQARFVVPGLTAREVRTVSYRMPGLRRGHYRAGPLRIRLTDPFNMVDVVRSFSSTSTFLVTPAVERLAAVEPPRSFDIGDNAGSHSIGAHGADDASTREYRTGDDLRKIHWRSSARAGMLMVRMEERPWQGRTTLLLDLRAGAHRQAGDASLSGEPNDDDRLTDSLEWGISAVASVGTHLMVSGREVGLLTDRSSGERVRFDGPASLADHLAGVEASPGADLQPAAGAMRAAARDSALVAVVGHLDPVSLQVLAGTHPRGSAVPAFAILLDVETWAGAPTADDPAVRVLEAAGWRVTVVRRGDSIADAWQALLGRRHGVGAPLGAVR